MTKGARYRLLAVVYGSQFFPLAFFLYGLTAVLREHGMALERIALLQLLALVWVAKFAWAPLVDRYGWRRLGHYRGWLLIVQALLVGVVLALVPVDVVQDLPLVLGLVGAIAVLSATHDIAADATAVRLLEPSERGVGSGIQKAGGYFGLMVGGGAMLIVYDRLGWVVALAVLAVLTALPLPILVGWRERETIPAATLRPSGSFRALGSFFGQPARRAGCWSSCPSTTLASPPPTPWSRPCWSTPAGRWTGSGPSRSSVAGPRRSWLRSGAGPW